MTEVIDQQNCELGQLCVTGVAVSRNVTACEFAGVPWGFRSTAGEPGEEPVYRPEGNSTSGDAVVSLASGSKLRAGLTKNNVPRLAKVKQGFKCKNTSPEEFRGTQE